MTKSRSARPLLAPRPFRLVNEAVRQNLLNAIRNLPIDQLRPLEVVIREEQKKRGQDQNAMLWAGPLKDISEQVFLEDRMYSVEVWATFFKREFLPDVYDPELCMEGYEKWADDPAGERVLIGSTTKLTVKGFSQYVEQIHVFGAHKGVQFTTKE